MERHLVDCSAECTYKQLRGGHISQSLHGIIYIANIITWHLLNQKKLAEWCWATAMAFWRTSTTKGVISQQYTICSSIITGKLLPIHANNKGKMILIRVHFIYVYVFSADTDLLPLHVGMYIGIIYTQSFVFRYLISIT